MEASLSAPVEELENDVLRLEEKRFNWMNFRKGRGPNRLKLQDDLKQANPELSRLDQKLSRAKKTTTK